MPDDVSIRTSNHHGQYLKKLYGLWGEWIDSIGEGSNCVSEVMIDTIDEFECAIFTLLTGFYRQSIGSLRNGLELITIGAYCQLYNEFDEFKKWRLGKIEVSFGKACDKLSRHDTILSLNSYLNKTLDDTLFDQRNKNYNGGWARRLYSGLSDYSHSRPRYTNSDMWQSNGPIYVLGGFKLAANYFIEVMTLCYILVKIGRPEFYFPKQAKKIYEDKGSAWSEIASNTYKYFINK